MKKLKAKLNEFRANSYNKRVYFMYRNQINTNITDFENMTEEEFKNKYSVSEIQWENLKNWEETEEYRELLFMLVNIRLDTDLLEVYKATKDKAIAEGNGAVIKAFLDLQKALKSRNKIDIEDKPVEEVEEDFDLD